MAEPAGNPLRHDRAAKAAAVNLLWRLDPPERTQLLPNVYCIVDAARDRQIYPALRGFAADTRIASLYQGATAQELAGVAPYLVSLGTGQRVFDWLWQEGWGNSWAIFFWSVLAFDGLRNHFRRLTIVETEERERLVFRFYDPRVLSAFLPICDGPQLGQMFGPVLHYVAEAEAGRTLRTFHLSGARLAIDSSSLAG